MIVLDDLLKGRIYQASQRFDEIMKLIDNEIKLLKTNPINADRLKVLYRMRIGDIDSEFKRKDLSHIPFNLRHLVATQRYSIPGVPCLYLGSSLYVCWVELGRPDLNKVWFSGFKLDNNETLNLINFAYRPAMLASQLNHVGLEDYEKNHDLYDYCIAYGVLLPLIAVCSVKKNYHTASFHVEYLLPQLLLEWLTRSNGFDGIRYFSTLIEYYEIQFAGINFALPTRSEKLFGFDDTLSNKFLLTSPVSWQLMENLPLTGVSGKSSRTTIRLSEDEYENYDKTEFGRMEGRIIDHGYKNV